MFSGNMLAVEVCKDRSPSAWLAQSSSSVDTQKSAKKKSCNAAIFRQYNFGCVAHRESVECVYLIGYSDWAL